MMLDAVHRIVRMRKNVRTLYTGRQEESLWVTSKSLLGLGQGTEPETKLEKNLEDWFNVAPNQHMLVLIRPIVIAEERNLLTLMRWGDGGGSFKARIEEILDKTSYRRAV
jgi:putative SOS response-associated peptidase YedK